MHSWLVNKLLHLVCLSTCPCNTAEVAWPYMVKHKVLLDKWHSRSWTLLVMGSWFYHASYSLIPRPSNAYTYPAPQLQKRGHKKCVGRVWEWDAFGDYPMHHAWSCGPVKRKFSCILHLGSSCMKFLIEHCNNSKGNTLIGWMGKSLYSHTLIRWISPSPEVCAMVLAFAMVRFDHFPFYVMLMPA